MFSCVAHFKTHSFLKNLVNKKLCICICRYQKKGSAEPSIRGNSTLQANAAVGNAKAGRLQEKAKGGDGQKSKKPQWMKKLFGMHAQKP